MTVQTYVLVTYVIVMLTGRLISQRQRQAKHSLMSQSQAILKEPTALLVLGWGVACAANRAIGENWSPTIDKTKEQNLVTSGVYSVVRHPFYLAGAFLITGTSVYFGNSWAWLGALPALIVILVRIPIEERRLVERFGKEYIACYYSGYLPLRSTRDEGVASQGIIDSVYDVPTMFADCRDVATNGTECLSPSTCSKSTGHFLFDLYHPHIAFGQVVVEGNAEVIHKGQDLWFVLLETVEQILGGRLFLAPSLLRRRVGRWWIGFQTLPN